MNVRFGSIVFGILFFCGIGFAQQFVTDGLIAMWTFDDGTIKGDTIQDVSGNGNDATIIGSLDTTDGVIGKALLFVAAPENYVEVPKLGELEQVSVECWAYEKAFGGIQGIVSTWQWAPGKVHFKFESNQIQVHKNDGVKIRFDAQEQTWYHIVYTTDVGAGELKLYVDGVLVDEGASGGNPELWNERRIGSEHDGRWLNGMVDEVRVYDRPLTPDEVAQNYAVKDNTFAVSPRDKLATLWARVKGL